MLEPTKADVRARYETLKKRVENVEPVLCPASGEHRQSARCDRGGPRRPDLPPQWVQPLWLTDLTEHPTREGKASRSCSTRSAAVLSAGRSATARPRR